MIPSSLTRSSTYPLLLRLARRSPGSSPRLSSRKNSSALFHTFGPARDPNLVLLSAAGSKFLLIFIAVLLIAGYAVACFALPSVFVADSPSATLLPLETTVDMRRISGKKSAVAGMLSKNRRISLETSSRLSGAVLRSDRGASKRYRQHSIFKGIRDDGEEYPVTGPVMVDYRDPGNAVPLHAALDMAQWPDELPIYSTTQASRRAEAKARKYLKSLQRPTVTIAPPVDLPLSCPQGGIRVFIGITSRSASPAARKKRGAIRNTWLYTIQKEFAGMIDARFMLSQPVGDPSEVAHAASMMAEEVARFGDITILPGLEQYRELPAKTLRLLKYALDSPCRYTHVVKTDDDVFLRPQGLLKIISDRERTWEMDVQGTPFSAVAFDGRRPHDGEIDEEERTGAVAVKGPWMEGMFVGKLDFNITGVFPGWSPIRNSTSKWYLPEKDLPDADCPLGIRWVSGWGYMLSRDLVQGVVGKTVRNAVSPPQQRPRWWGRLPWEDTVVAALIADSASLSHHPGFKAAWDPCDERTVLKHLDNDAPALIEGLAAQEASGLWSSKEVVCSSGPHEVGNYEQWRTWRNSLEDNMKGGFM